jgi:hypothetical protein
MSSKARWLVAVAVVAGVVVAASYYGRQENERLATIERSGPTGEVRRDGAPITEPVEPPATEALLTDQDQAEAQVEVTAREQQQAVEEQIRSFTIPIERGIAGMEEVKKLRLPPIPEFGETLRQFAAESDDPNWSAAMETRIFSEISQATGLSAGDVQVDCRATMCRVLLTKPASAPNPRYRGFNELVDSFGLTTVWILAVPDENGTPVNFAYIRRPEASATPSESQ